MNLYKINICPSGGFYSQIKGEMLFGMFCWAIAENSGKDKLRQYLEGYTNNQPFIVFSDAFPMGYLPKPTLPFTYYQNKAEEDDNTGNAVRKRKEFKRKNWIKAEKIGLPTTEMADCFEEVSYKNKFLKTSVHLDPIAHHTTGGEYSAYTAELLTYTGELCIYVLIDETRITTQEARQILAKVGQSGYGKKSSSGNGKFELSSDFELINLDYKQVQSCLTLAPCVPQTDVFNANKSFYHIFVRFGRHGNVLSKSPCPFKKPVMTADAGAVFSLAQPTDDIKFIGQGITGISQVLPETVFQGYAPIIPLHLKEVENGK